MISHIIWKKPNTQKSFEYTTIEYGVSQPLWNEGKGEKPSVSMRMTQDIRWATCGVVTFPTCKLKMPLSPEEPCPYKTFHWGFSSHRHPTWWSSHLHKRRKKPLYTKLKTLALDFFCSAKIPFSIVFPNFDGEGGIPANQDMRHKNAKGFHIAWPKPSRSGPAARIEPFPHQMCPIRGNLKLSPGGIQLHP